MPPHIWIQSYSINNCTNSHVGGEFKLNNHGGYILN